MSHVAVKYVFRIEQWDTYKGAWVTSFKDDLNNFETPEEAQEAARASIEQHGADDEIALYRAAVYEYVPGSGDDLGFIDSKALWEIKYSVKKTVEYV